ncbi:MAG TPA: hypothetical protein VLV89_05230, partial [Candidatus Acidoferrum sp.]|nr:hypothetical protein [Candidatus Acidoferrum sp.]
MRRRFACCAITVIAFGLAAVPSFAQDAQQQVAAQQAEDLRLAAQACAPGPVNLSARLQGAPWTETLKQGDYIVHDFKFHS